MPVALEHLLDTCRVVSVPLVTPFRGVIFREAMLFPGANGWTEFPFIEYPDSEAAVWLEATIDFGWGPRVSTVRSTVPVNATVPAVEAAAVGAILERFPGCRTVKVKVAEAGQVLADDVSRIAEVRRILGPHGRIRVDANGRWNVDEAERAIHAFARFDLEYVEQPCASVDELAELRERVHYMGIPIAADESVRKAADPLAVVRAGAADVLVIKAQPLGGITRALAIVAQAGLPVVVSSALETSIGLAMGAHLAAALPHCEFDSGLGTAALLGADITAEPLLPVDGEVPVRRVAPDSELLRRFAATEDRTVWWRERLERCFALAR